eukprot:CAMPEP_0114337306 /NCGR_PEP_ID=MMETSP0101-20121206/6278_1 /TAXON_ID=38822 ORGANISM="Pteridomonas danica, Strain PT" /NCGR_SAMPLE_ID=MMETSP0101 /ASSEMBLY_ACC=CAM_ASM_000211 /LENGTH=240 /DNA_ID=CAMNT_0001469503 /DNA_START=349 /DNA_END=1068 /DNA_ORIENTATION=+
MTVTILVSYNRISQVLPSITQLFVDSTNPKYILKVFLSLPKPIQSTMLQTLRIGYPDMPEMTMKNLKEKKKKKKKKTTILDSKDDTTNNNNNNGVHIWLDSKFKQVKKKFIDLEHHRNVIGTEDKMKKQNIIIKDIEELLNQVLVRAHQDRELDEKDKENDNEGEEEEEKGQHIEIESSVEISLDDASIITSNIVMNDPREKKKEKEEEVSEDYGSLITFQSYNELLDKDIRINPEFEIW